MENSTDKKHDPAAASREEKRETRLLLSKAKYFTLSWIGGIVFLVVAYVMYKQLT